MIGLVLIKSALAYFAVLLLVVAFVGLCLVALVLFDEWIDKRAEIRAKRITERRSRADDRRNREQ